MVEGLHGGVSQGLGSADVLHGLQNLEIHGLGPEPRLLAEVLPEFVGPCEGLLPLAGVNVVDVVVVEEVLLVGEVAVLVGGAHLQQR